jgi:hypothetical protein
MEIFSSWLVEQPIKQSALHVKAVLRLVDDPAPGSVENGVGNFYVPSNREAVKKNRIPRGSFHVTWRNHPIGVLPNDIRSQRAQSRWSPGFRINGSRTIQSRVLLVKE